MGRARVMWMPKIVIEELEDLKKEEQVARNQDAFRLMVKYTRVGREFNRIKHLNFKWKPTKAEPKRVKNLLRGVF